MPLCSLSYLHELDERILEEEASLKEEETFEHPTNFEVGMDVLCGPSSRSPEREIGRSPWDVWGI